MSELECLNKEDIEKAGFIYEPDASKCSMRKIRMHFDCNYYKNGEWTCRTTPELTKEWKEECQKRLLEDAYYLTHINKVFVMDNLRPLSGEGVMCRWVWISGRTDGLTKKWYNTGLLEGLRPNQLNGAASYLESVAKELISKAPAEGNPEYEKYNILAGLALSFARLLYGKRHPDAVLKPSFLVEDMSRFYDENKQLYEALKSGVAQDQDQQFMELYAFKMDPELLKEKDL